MRNSESTVVQFVYGDDNLNPEKMENNGRPVHFDRLRVNIRQSFPCTAEPALRSRELADALEAYLLESRFQNLLPTGAKFLAEIRDYYQGLATKQNDLIEIVGIDSSDLDRAMWNSCRVTRTQLGLALEAALAKYTEAFVEPGEAVGATGAQSISEPGTQMTLKVRMQFNLFVVNHSVLTDFFPDVPFCWRFFDERHSGSASSQRDY